MQNTYGYIRDTEGVDSDHIDVFLSDDIDGWDGHKVFVVDQRNADGSFDEHKVMLGFNDINDAEAAHMSNYEEGWQGLGAITSVSIEEFEKWIASSHRKTKAFAEYKSVKTTEGQSASNVKEHKLEKLSDWFEGDVVRDYYTKKLYRIKKHSRNGVTTIAELDAEGNEVGTMTINAHNNRRYEIVDANHTPTISQESEQEKENLAKKGVNVDDIVRQTEQAQSAIAAIQERIDNLKEFQQELTERFRKENETKEKLQGDVLATYLKERKAENNSGFYKIRPKEKPKTAEEGVKVKEEHSDDTLYRSDDYYNDVPRLNKYRIENIFGGIWIDNVEEFAKFVSAVNNSPFEENGEGIAYTDNYFYAYYLNIDGQVIPFASVYLNSLESQDVVNKYNQQVNENGEQRRVREYIDRANAVARNIQGERNVELGNDKGTSNTRRIDSVDSDISRKGRYFNRPSLYVKTRRADRFGLLDEYSRQGVGAYTDDEVSFENDPISKVLGKPRGTRKQRREFAERERQRMVARVNSLAKKLHLDNVEIVTDASALQGKKQRAKGFYSKSTGKITILIPNHRSTFDVEQTLLHEAVAHYGLRQLFGEHFDTFLDNVYNNADADVKVGIDALANEYGDIRVATEEYLASLAENEYFEHVNPSLWEKIKQWFMNMLAEAGVKLEFELSDNELRYILWRSYQNLANPGKYNPIETITDVAVRARLGIGEYAPVNENMSQVAEEGAAEYTSEEQEIIDRAKADGTYMKASNGQPTKLTPKQWVQVRTLAFKRWFGDWETLFKKNFLLNSKPVAALTGDEFAPIEGKKLTEQVENYFASIGGKAVSPLFGDVILDRKGADDSLSHGMGRNKAIAYAAVKEVIENGVLVDTHTNHKGRGYNTAIIAAPIEINGERYVCMVVVRRNVNENRFYLHEVTAQKNLRNDAFVTNPAQKPASVGDIANVLQNIVSASDNVSKIVDENWEPMVVYHRTDNVFTKYDMGRLGEITDINASDWAFAQTAHLGIWTNSSEQLPIGEWQKYKMPLFVNIKNPIQFNSLSGLAEEIDIVGDAEELRLNIQNEGCDGIILKDEEFGNVSQVSFFPNQIKSATENNGEFSTENDDIRFRSVQSNIADEYMAAVENGDRETAQRLEKEIAAQAKQVDSEIVSAVNNAAAGLNTGVEIVSDIQDVPDARRRGSKGWYEKAASKREQSTGSLDAMPSRSGLREANGKVYLVLPNAEGVEDAVETVLHEVVGHKGLRRLFGEKFDEMLADVFKGAPRNVRAEIMRRALDLMRRGRENFLHETVEEYLTPKIFPLSRPYNGRFRQRKQTTERKVIKGSITPSERSFRIAKSCLPSTDRQDFISLNQNIQVSK